MPHSCASYFSRRSLTSPQSQSAQLNLCDAAQDQSTAASTGPAAAAGATNTVTQPAWNPFDDNDFSNLTAEEFETDDKKTTGNTCFYFYFLL